MGLEIHDALPEVDTVVMGIGGGGLIALSQTILADIMTPRERAGYQVYIAGVFAAASVAGPLLGGDVGQRPVGLHVGDAVAGIGGEGLRGGIAVHSSIEIHAIAAGR